MPWYVNGELVDDAAVREEARLMRPQYQEATAGTDPIDAEIQLREWARENVVEKILLRQTALADPEPVPPEVLGEEAETEFRVTRLLNRVRGAVKQPAEKEISAWYKSNRSRFDAPELIWAKHIVKNIDENTDEAAARAALESAEGELNAGVPFEQVADQFSDCAGNGGDLGWFPRGEMVAEFDRVVFALPQGSTSAIFRTEFGFHIARVYGRKPAGVRPLADVREDILRGLTEERGVKAVEDFLDSLRAKADVRQSKGAP